MGRQRGNGSEHGMPPDTTSAGTKPEAILFYADQRWMANLGAASVVARYRRKSSSLVAFIYRLSSHHGNDVQQAK